MSVILRPQAFAPYGGLFPRSHAATPSDAIVPAGLVGWWTMDVEDVNFAAGTVIDRSGSGNVGTLVASPTAADGMLGQALVFNGTSQWINATPPVVAKPYTLCGWVYTANTSQQNKSIVGVGNNSSGTRNTSYIEAETTTTFIAHEYVNGTGVNLAGATTYLGNVWYHVVGVFNTSGNAYLYVNGKLDGSSSAFSSSSPTGINQAKIGGFINNNGTTLNPFFGRLDDVRIYNRALDQGEILQLYSDGLAGMGYWSGLGLLAPAPATSNLAPQRTLVGVGT